MNDLTKAELVRKLALKEVELRAVKRENQQLKSRKLTNVIRRFFRG